MRKTLTFILTAFITSGISLAQDSVNVTFRYYPDNNVTRVMLPGEFNDFGPNEEGLIAPNAVSVMNYNGGSGYWYKTVKLEVGGGESTYQNISGYRYKFHEHYNASGSENAWLADPLNDKVAAEGLGDSWLQVSNPMVFQLQPIDNSVFQIEEPGLHATIASIDSDPISELNSKIYINDSEVANIEGYYNSNLQILDISNLSVLGDHLVDGSNEVKIVAVTESGASIADSTIFNYVGENKNVLQSRPAGLKDGITYGEDGTSVTFSLYTPDKDNAFVIGDFTDWRVELDYQMFKDSISTDSVWFWKEITGLTPGQEYAFQYLVDGEIRVADPYSELVLDQYNDQYIPESVFPNLKAYPSEETEHMVGVVFPGKAAYEWEATDYQRPAKDELVIYELLLRDFLETPSYTTLIDTLDYLDRLGINAIELMPVNEFDGNLSWGYNPAFHMALDKYYGSPDEFKRFVDEAHKRGIAVILDVVLNHTFGQNPIARLWNEGDYGNPTSNNPYLNVSATHPFNVGYDLNHESPITKYYSKRVMSYWLEEYNVDGYRFDLSKGFTQTNNPGDVGAWGNYDQSRVDIWVDYANHIRSVDDDAYIILEHFADNNEEKALAANGMMLWGNMNHEYNEATMGYSSNLSGVLAQSRDFSERNLVGYMESHDEQWLMFKNISFGNSSGDYNITQLPTALDRMELAGAFFFTLPGPKMMWQFGELGYGYGDTGEQCLNDSPSCPDSAPGRTDNKPIRWDYLENSDRVDLYNAWADIINLRMSTPAFSYPEDSFYALSGNIKYIRLLHEDTDVIVIGNFGVTSTTQNVDFTQDGTWHDYFGETSISVSNGQASVDLAPGEFKIFTTKEFRTSVSIEDQTDGDQPTQFTLHQNYPNPFNPSTNLTYEIAEAGDVTLEVYNMLGQKVAELVNARKVPGTYTVQFDASNLSSGIYIARLSSAGSIQVQKMTLLK